MRREFFFPAWNVGRNAWSALRVIALAVLVACDGDPTSSRIGAVMVSTITDGGDTDDDGYFLSLDGAAPRGVRANGVYTFPRVRSGTHRLSIIGIADHCSLVGEDRQVITVNGDSAQATFHIDCPLTGVNVETEISGGDLDVDGFTIFVDGQPVRFIAGNDVSTIPRLRAGGHVVTLAGIAPNCNAGPENPRTVSTPARGLVTIRFQVVCAAFSGTIDVDITTSGIDLDRDGFTLYVDQTGPYTLQQTSNTLRFPRISAGTHTLRLEGVSSNCTVPNNPRVVSLSIGDTVRALFDINCARAERIAFSVEASFQMSLTIAYEDGSNTTSIAVGKEPSWSPDGSALVFTRVECDYYYFYDCYPVGLGVVDANGGDIRLLTNQIDRSPAWSPDGALIAFERESVGRHFLYHISSSGNVLTLLDLPSQVRDALTPAWSPDGTQLVFACVIDSGMDICAIRRDGSDFRRLTNSPAFEFSPAWSPDGTRIVLVTADAPGAPVRIATMDPDGRNITPLGEGSDPAWSRDGKRIVFVGNRGAGLYIMNADGSNAVKMPGSRGTERGPAWRP